MVFVVPRLVLLLSAEWRGNYADKDKVTKRLLQKRTPTEIMENVALEE